MSVKLQNSVFVHVPKTGGSWVREVLLDCCPGAIELPGGQHDIPDIDLPKFCFFRHPCDWYVSLWKYRRHLPILNADGFGWIKEEDFQTTSDYWVHAIDRCGHPDLTLFIDRVVSRLSSPLSAAYKMYSEACAYTGLQETLASDLQSILIDLNEPFDLQKFAKWKNIKINTSLNIGPLTVPLFAEIAIVEMESTAGGIWGNVAFERVK